MSDLIFAAPGIELSVDLFIANIDNVLGADISADLVDGSVDLNLDRAVKLAGSFTLRHPGQVRPYLDYLAPFLRLSYDDGRPGVYQQLGLFATSVPPGTSTIEDETATFQGMDLTGVLARSVFTDAENVASGTNIVTAVTSILAGGGMARVNLPATTRTAASDLSFSIGSSRLDAANALLQGIGWYELGTDLDGKLSTPGATRPLSSVQPFRVITDDDVVAPVETLAPGRDPSNVIVAVTEDADHAPLFSVARNDDPASPTSTVAMGRELSPPDSPLKPMGPMTQADLDAYTAQQLSASRSFYHVARVTILPDPTALIPHQVVQLSLTGKNAAYSGLWWVRTSQIGLTPGNAATVLECNRITDDLSGAVI
jgi:hypothetical protein